jgi:two-component system, sensor histidine kinase RpfC
MDVIETRVKQAEGGRLQIFRPFVMLRARLKARSDSEHEQAILRIVIVALVLAYMGFTYAPSNAAVARGHEAPLLLEGLAAALALAVGLFISICASPAPNRVRRAIGMVADAGAATFCMFLAGEPGVSMIGVYLFITFGNGFRYGIPSLFACQALCLVGFIAVLLFAPYWKGHQVAGWCLMVALVVLPIYVSGLLKRIKDARARAEEANLAKSSFLANMSHEMRTPLNGIVGVTDLLNATILNPQQAELTRLLRHSVMLLRSLVDDVLDISKIEAGRLTIEMADFDLHSSLNGLVRLLRPHAQAKGLSLHAMIDPAIEYRVSGDSHHLRQVLINLLSNAIKFTDRGQIVLEVKLLGETGEGLRLRFEVSDTGIGISESVQAKIFERFVQADESTTRRYGGTGLGTTIAKQLVELMGGVIGVKSALGSGSTFWFEIQLLKSVQSSALATANVGNDAAEPSASAAIFLSAIPLAAELRRLVDTTCDRIELVATVGAALAKLQALQEQGIGVGAVMAFGDVDTAFELFQRLSREWGDSPTAMIYFSAPGTGKSEQARLLQIDGVSCVAPDITPRVLRNAIHASAARESNESAQIIDLGQVLKEQRQPLCVLVAEDNTTNQTIIRKLLESAGHTVLLASDGEEALDIYERDQPELALLDFNMPERNGLEVVSAIRTMEPTGTRLPVIILSASVTVEARERSRIAGADEFVGKPFEAAGLLQVMDRLARRANRAQQGRARTNTQTAATTVALIDYVRMQEVERIAQDSAFITRLLRGFRGDVEQLLNRLDAAISNEQCTAVTDVTHAIRGAALGIGAQRLASCCAAIDAAATNRQFGQLRTLATEMRRCFDATSEQLNNYTNKKGVSL